MMKRRNVDCIKPRRPLKRNKISDGIYGSSVVYIKFVLIWLLVLAADYLTDFRFEYLWPFWLLLRSVYDSFRYQGLAFCVLFLCMAVTADMVAIVFIPASWLFFAASTYVWVQFVWHTEKGVCMPTIVLWAVFIYIEALVRLKEVKNVPFHLDLCRPFAAHCIGYPVVTLGFGLKSYVGYRLRQRKQREVARENEFYVQLLQDALPPDLQHIKNMNTAAAHAAAAVVKEFEENDIGESDSNGPISTSESAAGRGSHHRLSNHSSTPITTSTITTTTSTATSSSNSWSRDYAASFTSFSFFSKLRKNGTGGSSNNNNAGATTPASAAANAPPQGARALSWWKSWLSKPDAIYKNGANHVLNSCLTNSVSNSSTSSSCSSSSSSSSCSSSSSSSSSCSNKGRSSSSKVVDKEGSSVAVSTPNGSAVLHSGAGSSSGAATKPHAKVPYSSLHAQLEYMQKQGSVSARSVNTFNENTADQDKTEKTTTTTAVNADSEKPKNKSNAGLNAHQSNGSAKVAVSHTNNLRSDSNANHGSSGTSGVGKKNKNKEINRESTTPARDDSITIIKLEGELKRARGELSSSRSVEQELRNQINSLVSSQKLCQQEVTQLQQDNDTLQNKLHGLVTARQADRASLGGLERRVAEERRGRQSAEAQLQQLDRRARKLEEQQQRQQQHTKSSQSNGECSEACRNRRAELEAELKRLRREHRALEDRSKTIERENIALRQYKESQNDSEVLMSALSAMQERNQHLETTLSAETRVKLDLFSALGEAKRQIQVAQGHIERKDKEIEDLKAKITEVLAVCPATSFTATSLHASSAGAQPYHYSSSKLILPQVSSALESSLVSSMASSMASDHLNLESLVVGLGFAPPPPALSPSSSLNSPLPVQQQQPPISPPTPGPISPPHSISPQQQPQQQLSHSNLDPNARIYTPKGVGSAGPQDN